MAKSRSDADIEKTAVNLNDVIAQEMASFEADLNFKNKLDKKNDFDPELPSIFGVQVDFSQVFGNLLQNAIDALKGSPQARIEIITTHDNQCVFFLSIRDTGTGIDANDAERIFEPFYNQKKCPKSGRKPWEQDGVRASYRCQYYPNIQRRNKG